MLSIPAACVLGLVSVVLCANNGKAIRGLLAGALIAALGVAGLLFEIVTASLADRGDFKASQVGVAIVLAGIGAQVVIMAVAIRKPAAVTKRRRRR